jgi:hypothetical protein
MPGRANPSAKGQRDMKTDSNRETQVFRIVAGTIMVVAITFGVLQLMDIIHI